MRVSAVVAAILLCQNGVARADGVSAGEAECGGDAFSNAWVVEHRASRRGTLTAVPDTLCADLAPQHPPAQVGIIADPFLGPQVGSEGRSTPYDIRLPSIGRPLRPRNP